MQTSAADLLTTWARSHFNKKKKQEKHTALWKQAMDNVLRIFTKTLLVTNFTFKTGLYEGNKATKQISFTI